MNWVHNLTLKAQMVYLGIKPMTVGWWAQYYPLSYGWPTVVYHSSLETARIIVTVRGNHLMAKRLFWIPGYCARYMAFKKLKIFKGKVEINFISRYPRWKRNRCLSWWRKNVAAGRNSAMWLCRKKSTRNLCFSRTKKYRQSKIRRQELSLTL